MYRSAPASGGMYAYISLNIYNTDRSMCVQVGTCIGRRNYLAFVVFVVSCTALCVYVLAASAGHVVVSKRAAAAPAAFQPLTDVAQV